MRCVTLLLLGASCLSAGSRQIVLVKTVDGGIPFIHLSNDYTSTATAWITGCQNETGSQWYWSDQLLGLEGKPLEPGAETSYRVPTPPNNMMGTPKADASNPCEPYQVLAAVFADGTVTGGLTLINAILAERQKGLQGHRQSNRTSDEGHLKGN